MARHGEARNGVSRHGRHGTAGEVAERAREMGLHKETESVRKRAAELEDMRFIRVVGVRRCEYTNRVAEIWELVD